MRQLPLTRQGVRDLNQLGRLEHVHVWEHSLDCHCQGSWMLNRDEVCSPCLTVCGCGGTNTGGHDHRRPVERVTFRDHNSCHFVLTCGHERFFDQWADVKVGEMVECMDCYENCKLCD